MTRVIQANGTGSSSTDIDTFQKDIQSKLDNEGYAYTGAVNDGTNMDGEPTIGMQLKFDDATEANNFNSWLKSEAINSKDVLTDTSGNIKFDIKVHDCPHPFTNVSQGCEVGDHWQLKNNI